MLIQAETLVFADHLTIRSKWRQNERILGAPARRTVSSSKLALSL